MEIQTGAETAGRHTGALVISLDFELHWGIRDSHPPGDPYIENILGGRRAIPGMLRLFEEYEVAATWATVGFLFARNRDDLRDFSPEVRPRYTNTAFDPYAQTTGRNETDDPLHFGSSLVEAILNTARQEIASHTFSHYYCCESGQDSSAFRADLSSAQRIARENFDLQLRSLVFPRNQYRNDYLEIVRDCGFRCYRGNQTGRLHAPRPTGSASALTRAMRLADSFVPLSVHEGLRWDDLRSGPSGLTDVRASRFFRPCVASLHWLERLRLGRIRNEMRQAAMLGEVYHLWWHPHNFGGHVEQSLAGLANILKEYRALRDEFGFRSMSMLEAALEAERNTGAADV